MPKLPKSGLPQNLPAVKVGIIGPRGRSFAVLFGGELIEGKADEGVPLRIEIPWGDAVAVFAATIVGSAVTEARHLYTTDRRAERRRKVDWSARVAEEDALVRDVSSGGARIIAGGTFHKGDRVVVQCAAFGPEPVFGWILDRVGQELRMCFENPVPFKKFSR